MAVLRVQPGLEIVHTESSEQVCDRESERERRAQQQVVDQGFRIFERVLQCTARRLARPSALPSVQE